jgi:hypothetical protein
MGAVCTPDSGHFQETAMTLLVSMVLALVPADEPAREDAAAQARADNAAFRAFLKENKLADTWQKGDPIRLDTEAVRKAYSPYRAYYTFGAMPLGGGAYNPQTQKAFQEALAEYRKNSLSIAVLIKDGKVTVLSKPADFNTGLLPIKTDEDARTAAAAILSLSPAGELGPQRVEAKNVKVTHDKGWICTSRVGTGIVGGEARVTFDEEGRCTSVTMPRLMLPRPPAAAPPRPTPPPR